MLTQYYTATSLDGYIADQEHSLEWLFTREAVAMDPQQRVALEVAWEALENAGIAPDKIGESRTAVMLGVYYTEYQSAAAENPDTIDAYSATGNAHSVTVGRIAYLESSPYLARYCLAWEGPDVHIDVGISTLEVPGHFTK